MDREFSAEEVYSSFQEPVKCRDLVRMLLNSGLLPEILSECADYAQESAMQEDQP